MRLKRWGFLLSLSALAFTLAITTASFAQEERNLEIGALQYQTNEALTSDNINWPDEQPYTDQSMLENYGVIIGVNRSWTDPQGVQYDVQVAQVAHNKFSDIELVTPPANGAFTRTFRNPHPTIVSDGRDWTPTFATQDPVDPNIAGDAQIYHHLNTWTDIDVERWTYAFGNPEEDDYIIVEYRFTNRSGEQREDVYFGLTSATNSNAFYPGDFWGDYYGATYGSGQPDADTMRVFYTWDANETSAEPTIDDRGSPEAQYGHFQEPQSMFHAILHADEEAHDPGVSVDDDPLQPQKAGWSYRELSPDLNVSTHPVIYDFLSTGWSSQVPGQTYSEVVNKQGVEQSFGADAAKYRRLREGIDLNNFDPNVEQSKTALFSFGPYQMAPGEEVRIVTAIGGGQIPHRLAIDAGRAYENGNTAQQFTQELPDEPLPGQDSRTYTDDWSNEVVRDGDVYTQDGELIAEVGSMLTQQQKDRILDMSITDALLRADHVLDIWEDSDVLGGQGEFDINYAPASPSLEVTSGNQEIRVEWGNEAEADTRAGTVDRYRIYRDYWRPPAIDQPTDTTHEVIAEIDAGEPNEYVDTDVIVGETYGYYVTAVTEDGTESSAFQNRMGRSARPQDEWAVPSRAPAENWQDEVVVTPNPYHARAARKYSGRRINFLNLPAYAKIHIYTMTGDLVQTLDHDTNTGDREYQRQETFSTMEIVSGVYLYVVEELDGPDGSPTGEKTVGKFVVIK